MQITYLHKINLAIVEDTSYFKKVLQSQSVQRVVLCIVFDVCFAENVLASMVRLWYLATAGVSKSNSTRAKRINLKFMVGRIKGAIKHIKHVIENTKYFLLLIAE
jgi:hypothetical protein